MYFKLVHHKTREQGPSSADSALISTRYKSLGSALRQRGLQGEECQILRPDLVTCVAYL